jgi:hypothetical protein
MFLLDEKISSLVNCLGTRITEEKGMEIYIGGRHFKSKSAAKDHIRRDIIATNSTVGERTGDFKEIPNCHNSFLLDLLKHHPHYREKLPEDKTFAGFRAYYKGTPRPNYPQQYHRSPNNLVIVYGDGSLMDFSWCGCVDGFREYYRTWNAFRDSIDYQIKEYRAKAGGVSELSGKPVIGPGAVHHDQITFQALVESFLVANEYSWKRFDPRDEVLPTNISGQWKLYHETNAQLLFVSVPEHKKIHKGK